jgi:hypothetical protein
VLLLLQLCPELLLQVLLGLLLQGALLSQLGYSPGLQGIKLSMVRIVFTMMCIHLNNEFGSGYAFKPLTFRPRRPNYAEMLVNQQHLLVFTKRALRHYRKLS